MLYTAVALQLKFYTTHPFTILEPGVIILFTADFERPLSCLVEQQPKGTLFSYLRGPSANELDFLRAYILKVEQCFNSGS